MKLATLKHDNTRDGKLVIVSRDLTRAVAVPDIAQTLQYALDHWHECMPALEFYYRQLNQNEIKSYIPFSEQFISSPLPRAYQWVDGSAYVNHVELHNKVYGATLTNNFLQEPLLYQGGSDTFLGPHDDIPLFDETFGLDFEAEIAIITTDVQMGATVVEAEKAICLIMLVNDVSLRNLIPTELAKGFGFFQSKPSSAFSPVAVTPDELLHDWDGKKINLPLKTYLNGELFGEPNAGIDMTFDFPRLIAHAATTRHLIAGSIIGSGTISNYDRIKGYSCIAEKRMLEILAQGEAQTPFLKHGDHVRIEMFDNNARSIFGAINQKVIGREKNNHD